MKKRKEKNNGSFLSSLLLYKNKRLRVLNNRIEEKRKERYEIFTSANQRMLWVTILTIDHHEMKTTNRLLK